MTSCPCGSGKELDHCCGPYLDGAAAPTAEALMRSRYSAYALGRIAYLEETLAPEFRGEFDTEETTRMAEQAVWEGLVIRDTADGGVDDAAGMVEFEARYRVGKERHVHHERAQFRREDGRWLCAEGEVDPKAPPRRVEKVGRNEPCPCGSGKKYKKCCGA